MGVPQDSSPYGSQTLMGPGWPNVDEEALTAAAQEFEQLAMHLTGTVVPQLQGQHSTMSNGWSGPSADMALAEASTIINGHEINAAQASAIALQLHAMAAAVMKTKAMVNATAQETQHACEAIEGLPVDNKEELLQAMVKLGQSQNMADVTASTTELASNLGTPAVNPAAIPIPPGGAPGAGQASQDGQQGAQMMSQLVSQVGQLPQQLSKAVSGMGGGQGLQQLMQPLQQISSMFGKGGGSNADASPFAAFSNHPAAGGSGAGAGGGLGRGGSLPGAGGSSPRTPLMAKLVDKHTSITPAATAEQHGAVAGTAATVGAAPVGAAGGGMGGMGMMGARESGGGTRAGLAVPSPLDQDLGDDEGDDDW